MSDQYLGVVEGRSLRGLIAWLSASVLIAAWSPQLDPAVRKIWVIIGTFGLVFAVTLDLTGRVHRVVKTNYRKRATERRIERIVARIPVQNRAPAEIAEVLQRIAGDDRLRAACPQELQSWPRDASRIAELTPIPKTATATRAGAGPRMPVDIRDISIDSVGFFHCQPIDSRRVVLTFQLLDGESVSLVIDLQWQHQLAEGKYSSGGRFVSVRTQAGNPQPLAATVG